MLDKRIKLSAKMQVYAASSARLSFTFPIPAMVRNVPLNKRPATSDNIQSHPIGHVHNTTDFINFYESHYPFNRHTPSHRRKTSSKRLIFSTFQANPVG